MENIDIDMQTRSLDIDILKRNKPLATICSGDKAKLEELPDHGEVKIITYQCKVKRVKQDEGGGFLNNIINFFNEVSPGGWMSFFGTIAAAFVGVITYKLSEKQAEHRDRIKQRDEYRKVLLDNERKIDNILNSYKSYWDGSITNLKANELARKNEQVIAKIESNLKQFSLVPSEDYIQIKRFLKFLNRGNSLMMFLQDDNQIRLETTDDKVEERDISNFSKISKSMLKDVEGNWKDIKKKFNLPKG